MLEYIELYGKLITDFDKKLENFVEIAPVL